MCVLCTSLSSVRWCYCYNAGALDNMVLFAYVCAFTSDHHHLTFTSIDFQHWRTLISRTCSVRLNRNTLFELNVREIVPKNFSDRFWNQNWMWIGMFCNMVGWSVGRCMLLICFIIAILSKCNWIRRARKTMVLFFTIMMLSKNWSFFTAFLWKYLSICTKFAGDGVKEEVKKQRKSK